MRGLSRKADSPPHAIRGIVDAARRLAGAAALVRDGQRDLDAVRHRDGAHDARRERTDAGQGQPGDDGQSDEGEQDRDDDRAVDLGRGRVLESERVALLAQADVERHRAGRIGRTHGSGRAGVRQAVGSRRGGGHRSMVPRMSANPSASVRYAFATPIRGRVCPAVGAPAHSRTGSSGPARPDRDHESRRTSDVPELWMHASPRRHGQARRQHHVRGPQACRRRQRGDRR